MECAGCGTANREGARFCNQCAAPLVARCSSCKAELSPNARFCDECAAPVAAPIAAAVQAQSDGAVRKTVTVLFADLGGSTSFGERVDAETSRTAMAQYHALLQSTIDDHDGTVAKFMGDGMMATFGIPEIAEDDAIRAVRAAIDAQRRFHPFAADVLRRHGETLTLRVGVNTGEVVIASGDADLIGDALNVAARLEKACNSGHVLVGEETWRLTRNAIGFDALGEVTVAGRTQPVKIFEVAEHHSDTAEIIAPFVGRNAEMARLRSVFASSIAHQTAQLVTVLGSPGVGKTRLSRELCAAVASESNAITFEIRCDRAGDATFAPVAQMIREAAGLGDDTDAANSRGRVAALLKADGDRDRIVDVLAGVVGAASARSVEETFWAIRRLVESIATDRALVLVIDDIQWAEPLMLDLLEHLVEWLKDVAVVVVCLARPELREVRPALAEMGRRVADVLALDGLDSAATEQLAAGLLGTDRLPAGLIERLPASTDGNPLFVRELVRMLVDDQVIRNTGDGWELTIDADAVEVPPTIQSLLAARVERLPNDERSLLEFAAVVGAEFSLGALRSLAGDRVPIANLLEAMRRKELVEPTGTYWGDEPIHRFHHVLIRDAAYRRLLKTTRADLHERVAVWTDSASASLIGEHEASIAFHYEQAFGYRRELGNHDDATVRLGSRASELLSTAAQRALGRDDLPSAGALARRAIALTPEFDIATRANLLLIACECLLSSGDVATASPLVEQLREVARNDEGMQAWASCFAAQLIGLTDPQGLLGADEIASAAAITLRALGDGAGEAKAHAVRAGLLARLGRVGECEEVLDLALGAARTVDDRRRVTAVLGAAPVAALFGPSPVARAGGRCLDVVRLLRITTASPSVEATSMRCQAVLEALRGRFDVSRSMLASARATLEELGLRHGLLETDLFAGMVELIAGDTEAAIGPLRSAYDGLGTLGVGADAGQAAALLSRALLAHGDVDGADAMATASEQLAGQNLKTAISWRIARAEVLAVRGDVAVGVALAREAVEIAAATDYLVDHADACVAFADLLERAGDAHGCARARSDARRLYEAKGATIPASRLGDTSDSTPIEPSTPGPSLRVPAPVAELQRPAGPNTRTPLAENGATRGAREVFDLMMAGSHEEYRARLADDFVNHDHRAIVGGVISSPDAMVENIRVMNELGFGRTYREPLAVRGDRCELSKVTVSTRSGDSSTFLQVSEIDELGLGCYSAIFDETDLDAAIAELDERYLAGEGRSHAEVFTASVRFGELVAAGQVAVWTEMLANEFVAVGHAQIVGFNFGRDEYVAWLTETQNQADFVIVTRVVHVAGRAELRTLEMQGQTPDGSDSEWVLHYLSRLGADGRYDCMEWFDEPDFAAALARLDELGAADPRTPFADNEMMRGAVEFWQLIPTASDDELAAIWTFEDLVWIDRRRGIQDVLVGREATLANMREARAIGIGAVEVTPIAVRGLTLCLYKVSMEFGSFESSVLQLGEYDEESTNVIVLFDDTDLEAALAELDARYAAGEGRQHAEVLRAASSWIVKFHLGDPVVWRSSLTEEFECVNHQPMTGFRFGRDEFLAWLTETRNQVNLAVVCRTRHVVGRALLNTNAFFGKTVEGNEYEWVIHYLFVLAPDGRHSRIEMFDEADFAQALARLDEIGSSDSRTPLAQNRATALAAEAFELLAAGRVDEFAALFAEDATIFDRRPIVGVDNVGRAAIAENFRANIELGLTDVNSVDLAVRGDRVCLSRLTVSYSQGFVQSRLSVAQLNEDGLCSRLELFDADDLATALERLDAWYLEDEGRASPGWIDRWGQSVVALNERDWLAVKSTFSQRFVCVDHSPLGFPPADASQLVDEQWGSLVEVVPDVAFVATTIYENASSALASFCGSGHTREGNEYEWRLAFVARFDADGLVERLDAYQLEQWCEAVALFDELGAAGLHRLAYEEAASGQSNTQRTALPVANQASRRLMELVRLLNLRDWDSIGTPMAEEVVHVDRRRVVSLPDQSSSLELGLAVYASMDIFERCEMSVEAVRGERLALMDLKLIASEGFEIALLVVYEFDEFGLVVCQVDFDEDDLEAALQELDARYLAMLNPREAYGALRAFDYQRAFSAGDVEAVVALLHPDFVRVDHSRIGYGTADRNEAAATMRATFDVAPTNQMVCRSLDISGDVRSTRVLLSTTTSEGTRYETERLSVSTCVAGLITRMEYFDVEDHASAEARFNELAVVEYTPNADNAASRVLQRMGWLQGRGDLGGAGQCLSEDVLQIDRRRGVAAPELIGRQARMSNLVTVMDVIGAISAEVIAVRGERAFIIRWEVTSADGFAIHGYDVNETDDDGLICRMVTFDDSQLADAIEELEARHAAIEGDEYSDVSRSVATMDLLMNRGDIDGLADCLVADARVVDHSKLPFPPADRAEQFVKMMRNLYETVPNTVFMSRKVYSRGRVNLVVGEQFSTTPSEGNEYHWVRFSVGVVAPDGRTERVDLFPEDRWDDALTLFNELSGEVQTARHFVVENRALKLMQECVDLSEEGRFDDTDERVAPHASLIDRRTTVSVGTVEGHGSLNRNVRAIYEVFDHVAMECVAVRGERLALVRLDISAVDSGFAIAEYDIVELDDNGALLHLIAFDEGELLAALAELDDRYVHGEGAAYRSLVELTVQSTETLRLHDAERHFATFHADAVIHDHRRLGWGVINRDQYAEMQGANFQSFAGDWTLINRYLRVAGRAALTLLLSRAHDAAGSEYEWQFISVALFDPDGLIVRSEWFEEEDFEAAFARLEELGTDSERPPIPTVENGLTRAVGESLAAITALGVEAFDAVGLHEYVEQHDRRSVVSLPTLVGRQLFVDNVKATFGVFGAVSMTVKAVRGECLALYHQSFIAPGGFESSFLTLWEADADGLVVRTTNFDESALIEAFAELEDRYCNGEGAPHKLMVRLLHDSIGAHDRRDWEALCDLYSPDLVVSDHRRLQHPLQTRDDFCAMHRQLTEMVSDVTLVARTVEISGNVGIGIFEKNGHSSEGSEVTWQMWSVWRICGGLTQTLDVYELEDHEAARARFAELSATELDFGPDNTAVALSRRIL